MAVGPTQILIIAVIVLLLFGAGRIADIGKGLGEGIRNFKKGISGADDEGDDKADDEGDEDRSDEARAEPKKLVAKSAPKKKRQRKRDAHEA